MCVYCGNPAHAGWKSPESCSRPPEYGAELFAEKLELIDALERLEQARYELFEIGPELDPAVRSRLREEIRKLLAMLGVGSDEEDPLDDDFESHIKPLREALDDSVGPGVIDVILQKLGLDENEATTLRPAIEKVLLARQQGSDDRQVYRKLVRTYHPDVTVLWEAHAIEVLKLIHRRIWDEQGGRFRF